MTREQQIHFAGMILDAEAHTTRTLDELSAALDLAPGDQELLSWIGKLTILGESMSWRAERMREAVEAA